MGRKVIEDRWGNIKIISDGIIRKTRNIGEMLIFKRREKIELITGVQEKVYNLVLWMMGKD